MPSCNRWAIAGRLVISTICLRWSVLIWVMVRRWCQFVDAPRKVCPRGRGVKRSHVAGSAARSVQIDLSVPRCFDKRQHPLLKVQMHVRSRVPLLKAVPLHTVLAKFRVTQLQLFIAQIRGLVAPNRSQVSRSELGMISRHLQNPNNRSACAGWR
jgi:hypothetical protein